MNIERKLYLERLKASAKNSLVKIVSGIRRCGKSYLLDPIWTTCLKNSGVPENHIIKIALDSIENEEFCEPKKLYDFVMSKIVDGKKNYKQLEIDFIATKGREKYYIQSAFNIDGEAKRSSEKKSLLSVRDNFKKIIISGDHFIKWQDDDGIIYLSVYDFLLDENSLAG